MTAFVPFMIPFCIFMGLVAESWAAKQHQAGWPVRTPVLLQRTLDDPGQGARGSQGDKACNSQGEGGQDDPPCCDRDYDPSCDDRTANPYKYTCGRDCICLPYSLESKSSDDVLSRDGGTCANIQVNQFHLMDRAGGGSGRDSHASSSGRAGGGTRASNNIGGLNNDETPPPEEGPCRRNNDDSGESMTLEAGEAPVCTEKIGDSVRVAGLLDCLAVFVTTYNAGSTRSIIGGHFVTSRSWTENGGLNQRGQTFVQRMQNHMQELNIVFNADTVLEIRYASMDEEDHDNGRLHDNALPATRAIEHALNTTADHERGRNEVVLRVDR